MARAATLHRCGRRFDSGGRVSVPGRGHEVKPTMYYITHDHGRLAHVYQEEETIRILPAGREVDEERHRHVTGNPDAGTALCGAEDGEMRKVAPLTARYDSLLDAVCGRDVCAKCTRWIRERHGLWHTQVADQ